MNKVEFNTGKVFGSTMHYLNAGEKVIIHKGGTGSGKTYEIMLSLLTIALQQSNKIITVVSESFPHLKIGTIRILSGICNQVGLFGPKNWNKSESVWTSPTGSIIEFFSADRISKALGARRDYLYGNEFNTLRLEVWDELARRSEIVIADFNPTSKFWLEEWILNYDNTRIITSNYRDNKFLPETERTRIEKRASRDDNFRRVHVDCEYGIYKGLIFTNWTQINRMPKSYTKQVYALDWGFVNDPSVILNVMQQQDDVYIDELLYRTGMLNRDIIKTMEQLGIQKNYDEIIADSAEQKSISEIALAGFNIKPAIKGKGSVDDGIKRLLSKNIYVTSRSTNVIKELRNYSWVLDKDGNPTNKPCDTFNHAIDCMRYGTENRFVYSIA